MWWFQSYFHKWSVPVIIGLIIFFFFSSYGRGCVSLHLISYAKKWEWFNAQWICISVSSDNHWIFNYGGEKEEPQFVLKWHGCV